MRSSKSESAGYFSGKFDPDPRETFAWYNYELTINYYCKDQRNDCGGKEDIGRTWCLYCLVHKLTRTEVKEIQRILKERKEDIQNKRKAFNDYSFLKLNDVLEAERLLTQIDNVLKIHESVKKFDHVLNADIVRESNNKLEPTRTSSQPELEAKPASSIVKRRMEKRLQMAQLRLEELREDNNLEGFFKSVAMTSSLVEKDVAMNVIALKILFDETFLGQLAKSETKVKTKNGHTRSDIFHLRAVLFQYYPIMLRQCEMVLAAQAIDEDITLAAFHIINYFVQGTKIQLCEEFIVKFIYHIISDKFLNHGTFRIPALTCLMAIAANRNFSKQMFVEMFRCVNIKLNEVIRNSITGKTREFNTNEENSTRDLARVRCFLLGEHTSVIDFFKCRMILEESFESLFCMSEIGGPGTFLVCVNFWNCLVADLIGPARATYNKHRLFYKPIFKRILTILTAQLAVPSKLLVHSSQAEYCKHWKLLIAFIQKTKAKTSCPLLYAARKLCLLNLVQFERLDAVKIEKVEKTEQL